MKIDNKIAADLSIKIINWYCRKDMTSVLSHLDEKTFFIGPREGQIIRCGTDIENAWISNLPMPDFSVSDIEVSSVTTSPTTCEVLLHYYVIWHKKDGTTLEHPQIMQVSWFIKQKIDGIAEDSADHDHYKVAVMHISNPVEPDERDLVYNTFGDIATSQIGHLFRVDSESQTWITIPGIGAIINRYPLGGIPWVESASSAHKSIVHTRDRDIRCSKPLSWFMQEYPGCFLQPSASFLVNPVFIKTLQRFTAELWNGQTLRIPEKKYSAFKRDYLEFLNRTHDSEGSANRSPK